MINTSVHHCIVHSSPHSLLGQEVVYIAVKSQTLQLSVVKCSSTVKPTRILFGVINQHKTTGMFIKNKLDIH